MQKYTDKCKDAKVYIKEFIKPKKVTETLVETQNGMEVKRKKKHKGNIWATIRFLSFISNKNYYVLYHKVITCRNRTRTCARWVRVSVLIIPLGKN